MTHDLSETARSLLRAAATETAPVSSRDRARLKDQILARVATAPWPASTPESAVTGLGAKSFGLKVCAFLAGGAGLGLVVAAGVSGLSAGGDAEPSALAKQSVAAKVPVARSVLPRSASAADTPANLERASEETSAARAQRKEPERKLEAKESAVAESADGNELRAELDLMQRVHAALRDRRGQAALELIRLHDQRFPRGQLGSECLAAEVFAACQIGDFSRAQAARERFLSRDATSPLAQRVRRTCEASRDGLADAP